MEAAGIDSGLRRNDGWGSRGDGECDHTARIPAQAGMTVGGDGMTVNTTTRPRGCGHMGVLCQMDAANSILRLIFA